MAWWIFQNLVMTTVLAAVVAMIGRTNRIGPVARHALWVLVLVKFVTPPIVVWPWAAPDPLGLAAIDARANDPAVATPSVEPVSIVTTEISDARADGQAPAVSISRRDQAASSTTVPLWPCLFGIWAAGSLVVLVIEGARLRQLAMRINAGVAAPADSAIVARVAALSLELGLRPVPVVAITGQASPAVWGFGRPRLLWPETLPVDVTDACIDGLLVHELAHVKRRDHLVGWIELAAGIVWWWNPLFWFVRSSLREQAELACDAWVISALPNGRRAYAESLLALSAAAFSGASSTSSMAVVGIRATNRRVLERRLVMIMKGRAPLRLPVVGLFCLAIVAMATLPAWATSAQQPAQSSQSKPEPVAKPPQQPTPAQAAQTPQKTQPAQPVKVARPATLPTVHVVTPEPAQVHVVPKPAQAVHVLPSLQHVPVTPVFGPEPQVKPAAGKAFFYFNQAQLPEDSQKLIAGFEASRDAIQKEVDQKIAAARDAVIKELEKLQDQYTKAGKLDEAIAIRDYLRAGGPPATTTGVFVRKFNR